MTKGTRGVTIVVHADGDLESKQYRFPRWAVIAGKWGAGVIAVLVVLFFAFAGPISRSSPGTRDSSVRCPACVSKTAACSSSPPR